MTSSEPAETLTPQQLRKVLDTPLGPVDIENLQLLTGGASRQTWSFDAIDRSGRRHPLILQRERGGSDTVTGPDFATEDRLLRAAAEAGVPVASIVADSEQSRPLGHARITRRVDGGETLGGRIVHRDRFASLRRTLVARLGSVLAAVHTIPPEDVPGLDPEDPLATIRTGLDVLEVRSPTFELALQHLTNHTPTPSSPRVLHGDFRVGNLLVDADDLHLVLDWELAHIGHPIEDLGWLCVRAWRFGGERVVGGIGDVDDLLTAYEQADGTAFTPDDLRWGIIAGTLRWGLICAHQASRHLDGSTRSVELAAIGRRLVENEHDLLDLLDVAPSPIDPDRGPASVPAAVDHGRPTAVELLDAVRDHLEHRVAPLLDGADAYQLRVARNALGIVERELFTTPSPEPALDEAALAAAIRSGHVPDDDELVAIRAAVTTRLTVANPAWLR